MSNFDIKFEPVYSNGDRISSFTLTFLQRSHDIALGFYAVYPSIDHRELILMPKFKFDEYRKSFEELSKRIVLSEKEKEKEKAGMIKPKNRKFAVTENEVKEAKKLRSIISHSHIFKISGSATTISLPGKYLEMLKIKEDYLTFVQTGSNEYIIINPNDAWQCSGSRNFNYPNDTEQEETESTAKALFSRLKKAI